MSLRETTRTILKQVEETSGYPVLVQEDARLPTFASIRMARGGMPAHMLRYRLLDNQAPDYAIVYQCGFILRLFANQPAERFMLAETSLGQEQVKRLVLAETAPLLGLTTRQAADLQGQLLAGLLVHVQSVPVGLRIGRWLRQSFAEFHPAQRETVMKELAVNRESLKSEVRKTIPKAIVNTTLAINAAYALFWARELADPELAFGYHNDASARQGRQLLKLWDETPPAPDHDRALVDRWADLLGLSDWYQWVPYSPPA